MRHEAPGMGAGMAEPIESYVLTAHARFEMERRGIGETVVHDILQRYQQDRQVLAQVHNEGEVRSEDAHLDLSIIFKDGVAVVESDEEKPDVILDFDEQAHLVSIEVLDASERITEGGR